MFFDFSFKSSTLLIFFINGIVFSVLLLQKGKQSGKKSSFWLAVFIFLCALYIAPFMFGYAGWYSKQFYRDILFYMPFQQLFLLPPILFFYVKSLFNNSLEFKRIDWIHFIPTILYLLYSLIIFITDKLVLNEYYFYENGRDKDFDLWYQFSGFILMVVYLFMCLKLYTQYRKNTYQTVSFADAILLTWIQRFLVAFLLLLIIRLLFFIINPEWENFGNKYWYYLSFSILFYYIAVSGYTHAVKMVIPFHPEFDFNQPLEELFQGEKNEESLTSKDITMTLPIGEYDEDLKNKIGFLMEKEKVFKNPDLTLFDIAKKLETHPKKVSLAINRGFKMNFNDFVNSYRTKEVIKALQSNEDNLKSLLGIAFDSGFNSKSTFNRAFKKQTQMNPKDYVRATRKK